MKVLYRAAEVLQWIPKKMLEPRGINSSRAPPLPHPYLASNTSQKIKATVLTLARFSGGFEMASKSCKAGTHR